MPVKHRVKEFLPGGIYHIYSRGIEERQIFADEKDFDKFIGFMRTYAGEYEDEAVKPGFKSERLYVKRRRRAMNLHGEVEVWAYCLMPNHFHLLVKQNSVDGITKFMRRILTGYVMYFNEKYERRGGLFEGIYKGVLVDSVKKAAYLSRHIHLNPAVRTVRKFGPVEAVTSSRPLDYPYSSYKDYLGQRTRSWVVTGPILNEIEEGKSYEEWGERTRVDDGELGELLLD